MEGGGYFPCGGQLSPDSLVQAFPSDALTPGHANVDQASSDNGTRDDFDLRDVAGDQISRSVDCVIPGKPPGSRSGDFDDSWALQQVP